MLSSADRPNRHLLCCALLIGGLSAVGCRRWGYELDSLGETCDDGVENGDETGLDCGGSCLDCVVGAGGTGGGPSTGGSGGTSTGGTAGSGSSGGGSSGGTSGAGGVGGTGGSGALGVGVGRVGHWEFDDGMGSTAMDSSGNGNDGVLMEYAAPTWGAGRTSGALGFNGFTEWVRVPNSTSLDSIQTNNQVTVAAWVYRTPQSDLWSSIASQQYETGEDEHYELTFYEGALTFIVSTDQYRFGLCSDPNLGAFDEWIHVAGSFDGETIRAYMNGVEVCSLDLPGTMSPGTTPLIIGGNSNFANNDAQEVFAGYMDELALYNRALSASEIASLAAVN